MSQKTIKINPAFLSVSRTRKVKDDAQNKKGKKTKPKTYASPNIMRKELLSKIKDYQNKVEKSRESEGTKVDVEEFDNEFNRSLGFLQNLNSRHNEKKNRKREKRKTFKKERGSEIHVATELPDNLKTPQGARPTPPPTGQTPSHNTPAPMPALRATGPISIKEPPPYSSLKNGSKPTFREWKRQTQKIAHQVATTKPLIRINNRAPLVPEATERSKQLERIKREYKGNNPRTKPRAFIRRRTRTIKYKLGKADKKVSVLIKNHNTRKLVKHEQGLLKQKSIMEVKNFLREKNLLKTGSNAPNDVLRQMYEQSILAGDVSNNGKDTLIHNYLHANSSQKI
jgi:hypothetical protein